MNVYDDCDTEFFADLAGSKMKMTEHKTESSCTPFKPRVHHTMNNTILILASPWSTLCVLPARSSECSMHPTYSLPDMRPGEQHVIDFYGFKVSITMGVGGIIYGEPCS